MLNPARHLLCSTGPDRHRGVPFRDEVELSGSGETGEAIGLVVQAVAASRPSSRYRPSAPIVTQLFAASLDVPQARARRRASTQEGIAAYGATGTALRLGRRATGLSWPA
jgi:hypothetical protein